jgi:hypothetical protein
MQSLTEELVEKFCSHTLPKQEWTHEAHLKVGLWHLLHYSREESLSRLRQGIKQYNIACEVENTNTQGYHETITRFYVLIIDKFLRQVEQECSIDLLADELIKLYGDKSLPLAYYSKDRLFSIAARRGWLEPNLKPISKID